MEDRKLDHPQDDCIMPVKGGRQIRTAVAKSDRASQDELSGLVQMSREASSGLGDISDTTPQQQAVQI